MIAADDPLLVYANPRDVIESARATGEGTAAIPIALDRADWRPIGTFAVAPGAVGVSAFWAVDGRETTILVEVANASGAALSGALGRLAWAGADGPEEAWFAAPSVPAGGRVVLAVVLDRAPDLSSLETALVLADPAATPTPR